MITIWEDSERLIQIDKSDDEVPLDLIQDLQAQIRRCLHDPNATITAPYEIIWTARS